MAEPDDLVAVRAKNAAQPRLDARIIGLHDRDFLLDAVRLQSRDDGIRRDRHRDVPTRHLAHPPLQILTPLDVSTPDRQRRDAQNERVGLGVHDTRNRSFEGEIDLLELLFEIGVRSDRIVGDHHARNVIGDTGGAHVIVFGLHHRIRRGRGDTEGQPPGQIVAHVSSLPVCENLDACRRQQRPQQTISTRCPCLFSIARIASRQPQALHRLRLSRASSFDTSPDSIVPREICAGVRPAPLWVRRTDGPASASRLPIASSSQVSSLLRPL